MMRASKFEGRPVREAVEELTLEIQKRGRAFLVEHVKDAKIQQSIDYSKNYKKFSLEGETC